MSLPLSTLRADKWLWAARFFKTRALAVQAIERGRVQIEQRDIKPSKELRAGDLLTVWQGDMRRTVRVVAVSDQRGAAPLAQQLYEETPESIAHRAVAAEQRRLSPEPAHSIPDGRPTKRDRRELQKNWNSRWSASLD